MNELYEFLYCSCIHESGYVTMSLHRTKEGAERAMYAHREKARKEWEELYAEERGEGDFDLIPEFGQHEAWRVNLIQVQD